MIKVSCCKCNESLEYPNEFKGKPEPCPQCGNTNLISDSAVLEARVRMMLLAVAVMALITTSVVSYSIGAGRASRPDPIADNYDVATVSHDSRYPADNVINIDDISDVVHNLEVSMGDIVAGVYLNFDKIKPVEVVGFKGYFVLYDEQSQPAIMLPFSRKKDLDSKTSVSCVFEWTIKGNVDRLISSEKISALVERNSQQRLAKVYLRSITDSTGNIIHLIPESTSMPADDLIEGSTTIKNMINAGRHNPEGSLADGSE